jgi:outer membrane protein assembly factor BamB
VAEEARRVAGRVPGSVALTHPANWGPRRRGVLTAAAEAAGLTGVTLVAEPVAAAAYFIGAAGRPIPDGSAIVVYDFGAGTFDVSVVRRVGDGFAVVATRGLDDAGGLDIDAAIVGHLGAVYLGRDPAAWQRLAAPATAADRRARRQLWDDVRTGKEALARMSATVVPVPIVDEEAPLGRDQLELLAGPVVGRTVATTRSVLSDAGLAARDLAGVFLVGGSSRLPMAATEVHRALGVAPFTLEQPEIVVAEGSLHVPAAAGPPTEPTALTPVTPNSPSADGADTHAATLPPAGPVPAGTVATGPAPTRHRTTVTRRRLLLAAGAAVALTATTTAVILGRDDSDGTLTDPPDGPRPSDGAPTTSPNASSAPPAAPGTVLWQVPTVGVRHRPVVDGPRIYLMCDDGTCYARATADGSMVWRQAVSSTVFANDMPAPVPVGDRVYVATHDGRLLILNAATGTVERETRVSDLAITSTPTVANGTVYLSATQVLALDATTLAVKWKAGPTGTTAESPVLAGDVVLAGSNGGVFRAFAASDGAQRWRHETEGQVHTASSVVHDGAVFFGCGDGYCYAVNVPDGTRRWRTRLGEYVRSSPTAAGSLVFIGSRDTNVYALTTGEGKVGWRAPVGGDVWGQIAVADGVVYAGSNAGRAVALDATNGSQIWNLTSSGVVIGSPAPAGAVAYVGDQGVGNPGRAQLVAVATRTAGAR